MIREVTRSIPQPPRPSWVGNKAARDIIDDIRLATQYDELWLSEAERLAGRRYDLVDLYANTSVYTFTGDIL